MQFKLFAIDHLTALFLTLIVSLILVFTVRKYQNVIIRRICTGIVISIMVSGILIQHIYRYLYDFWTLIYDLPMQLCDWACFCIIAVLVFRKQWIYECIYFWGLGGTMQAMITPNLDVGFPHIKYFYFFLFHSGIIIGVSYFVLGLKHYPKKGAILRVAIISQVYLIAALIVNYIINANYGFLMEKPDFSMLNYLGPWPWYILGMEGAGLIFFLLLYTPFYFINRKQLISRCIDTDLL